jgi:hypothetical protein
MLYRFLQRSKKKKEKKGADHEKGARKRASEHQQSNQSI